MLVHWVVSNSRHHLIEQSLLSAARSMVSFWMYKMRVVSLVHFNDNNVQFLEEISDCCCDGDCSNSGVTNFSPEIQISRHSLIYHGWSKETGRKKTRHTLARVSIQAWSISSMHDADEIDQMKPKRFQHVVLMEQGSRFLLRRETIVLPFFCSFAFTLSLALFFSHCISWLAASLYRSTSGEWRELDCISSLIRSIWVWFNWSIS